MQQELKYHWTLQQKRKPSQLSRYLSIYPPTIEDHKHKGKIQSLLILSLSLHLPWFLLWCEWCALTPKFSPFHLWNAIKNFHWRNMPHHCHPLRLYIYTEWCNSCFISLILINAIYTLIVIMDFSIYIPSILEICFFTFPAHPWQWIATRITTTCTHMQS